MRSTVYTSPASLLEDGRRVARARPYLEDALSAAQLERLDGEGHDVRLGDGLRLLDGEGGVFVGELLQRSRDELLARHGAEGLSVLGSRIAASDESHHLAAFHRATSSCHDDVWAPAASAEAPSR